MGGRISAAERRAAALKKLNVTPGKSAKAAGPIVREVPDTGTLEVRYPPIREGQVEHVIDLSFLGPLDNLKTALAHGTALHGRSVRRPQTRERIAGSLRMGFVRFLVSKKMTGMSIGDVTTDTLRRFKQWIDAYRTSADAPLSEGTRSLWLHDLQIVLDQLRRDEEWKPRLSPSLERLDNPYPNAKRKHKPTVPLTDEDLETVLRVASSEAVRTMRRIGKLLDQMAEAPGSTEWASTSEPTLAHAANTLWERRGIAMPGILELRKTDPQLARRIDADFDLIKSVLLPSVVDLAPFIILFALHFRYNHSTLFGAKRDDFSTGRFLGKERLVAKAYKPRSRRRQPAAVPVTDDPDNPATLLAFMDRWTARAREQAPASARRHLFIARANRANGFIRNLERMDSLEIFGAFSRKAQLPHIGMRILRATGLDVVHDIFRGDFLAIMAASGQKDPQTFVSHYSNGGVRLRNEEALAQAMVLKERWMESGGTIDPRLNRGDDHAAATPGFICLDPYSSPFPDQADKSICAAYGMCPMCPFAIVMRNSGYAFAQLLLLTDAVERTIADVTALSKWGPVHDRLRDYWLRVFTEEAEKSALETYSDLPTLPEVN